MTVLEGFAYSEIRPLGNAVLLGQNAAIEKSDGGIYIPPVAQQEGQMAYYVVAVGPKVKDIVPGDKVVTPLYFEHVVLEDGTGRKLVRDTQILGVLRD